MKCYREKYASFTVEDFVEDRDFRRWVLTPDEETEVFWHSFLRQYPAQSGVVTEARSRIQATAIPVGGLTAVEKNELRSQIFEGLQLPASSRDNNNLSKKNRNTWLMAAAVTGLLFIGGAVWLLFSRHTLLPALYTHTTAPRQVEEITLPDSSVVILNGNSSIWYDAAFQKFPQREIHLSGNAYFKVRRTVNSRPFIVHANQVIIHVTGTEFNVDARSRGTDVVLTKGNINISLVEKHHGARTTSLTAGEEFRIDTLNQTFLTQKTNTELYTAAWEKGEWHF
jgi:ferric-dicitrate binding protein FerR (iron transport regulator)